jgi:hypothetical protein
MASTAAGRVAVLRGHLVEGGAAPAPASPAPTSAPAAPAPAAAALTPDADGELQYSVVLPEKLDGGNAPWAVHR